jgi:phage protein D
MPDLADSSAFYTARPRLFLDGTEETALADGLGTLLVEEVAEGLFRCELTIGNWGNPGQGVGYLYFDRQVVDFGRRLEIRIGDGETEGRIFSGAVTGIEGRFPQNRPPEIALLAEGRLQDLRMTRRSRSFEEVSDADVMQQIAGDHGLQSEVDVAGPTHRSLTQLNQSDLAFLRERARAVDAELWIEDATLHVQARAQRRAGELTLTYGQRLREFSVLADLAGQCTRLAVTGWDPAAKQAIDASADTSSLGAELVAGQRAGSAWLSEAFGERPQQLVHLQPSNDAQAQGLAEAHFRRGARRFLSGTGLAEGDARLRAGVHLGLDGLGPLFDGPYYVAEVRHSFGPEQGYLTQFRVERTGMPS